MSASKKLVLTPGQPLVVAAVHSPGGLRLARRLKPGEVDVLEFRVDMLSEQLKALEAALNAVQIPVLITVRHPAEGGQNRLGPTARKELYRRFLPFAAALDVELRSLPGFAEIVDAARAADVKVIISNHDFRRTPPLDMMLRRQREAARQGAEVFKIAALTNTAAELARMIEFTGRPAPVPHSVMGMGRLGKASRLALAAGGSVLNYGYLDAPNAPGQWEARELKRLLGAVVPPSSL